MKHHIKTVAWKFKDATIEYPQLSNSRIKISSPQDIVTHFRFCLMVKLKNASLYSGLAVLTSSLALK